MPRSSVSDNTGVLQSTVLSAQLQDLLVQQMFSVLRYLIRRKTILALRCNRLNKEFELSFLSPLHGTPYFN